MKRHSFRAWLNTNFMSIIYGVSSAVLLINILSLYSIFTVFRTSNDECLWSEIELKTESGIVQCFRFNKVKENGVTWNAGIRDGDLLLEINHIPVKSSAHAQDLLNRIGEGQTAVYRIQKGSSTYEVPVTIKKLVDIGSLSFGLVGFIWFIVGFLVILAKPEGYLQRLFFAIGVLFTIVRSFPLVLPALPAYGYHPLFVTYYFIFIVASVAFPLYYYRFFVLFPSECGKRLHKRAEYIINTVSILLALFSTYRYLFPGNTFFAFLPGFQLHTITFVSAVSPATISSNIAFIVGFQLLIYKYYSNKLPDIRKRISLILVAYGLGLAGMLFVSLIAPKMGYIIYNSPELFTPILLVVCLPIAFAISIFRFNLMDMSTVVKNAILYGTATITVAIIYFLFVLGMGNAIGAIVPAIYKNIVSLFFFVLFAIIFQTKKDKFQELLTRKFYPEQYAYRKMLLGFHQQLSQIIGREKILDALESLMVDTIKVQKSVLLLKNAAGDTYHYERMRNTVLPSDPYILNPEKIVRLVNEKKRAKNEAVFTQESFHELFGKRASELTEQGIFTVVPLICGNHVPGFLLLGLKRSGSQFGGRDLMLLASVAGQVSISLENARLYEAEVQKIELEKELEVARTIQQNLLPKQLPVSAKVDIYGKMIPAQHIGGDYFDIIELDENRFFVAVGDVSGKGLPASLYMARVQTLVQAECRQSTSPYKVLLEVNKKLIGSIDRKSFITMSLAFFDMEKGTVRFCRAGHLPLMVQRNGMVDLVKPPGIGLGLDKGTVFDAVLKEEEYSLESGQAYIFLSDGVNEAMNVQGDCIGTESIMRVLLEQKAGTSRIMAEATWNAIANFRESAEPNDDMTLVIVKINECL